MSEGVEIVKLPTSDWAAYRRLRLEALQTDPHAFGSSYGSQSVKPDAYWIERLRSALGSGNWLLFARERGELVGMIGAFLEEGGTSAFIIAVYVTPTHRGRGISKQLMAGILQEIEPLNARLTVNKEQAPALALYRSFGFEVVDEIQTELGDGKLHDEYVMELRRYRDRG